jgi:hypothetical protein
MRRGAPWRLGKLGADKAQHVPAPDALRHAVKIGRYCWG